MNLINPAPVFPLYKSLHPLLDVNNPDFQPLLEGPRQWWNGILDTEGLALGAAQCFAFALANFSHQWDRQRTIVNSARVAGSFGSITSLEVDGQATTGLFAPLSSFFPTSDGWIRTHANYPHHEKALLRALGAADLEGVKRGLAQMRASDAERIITEQGGVASQVRSASEWKNSDNARRLSQLPWIQFDLRTTPTSNNHRYSSTSGLPLHGLRILDLTRVIAGPSAGRLLGSLGADVLRIDPPEPSELVSQHLDTGFNKRSAIANLGSHEQWFKVDDLLRQADAIMLGYSLPGLKKFGFDPESLMERHPHLAVVFLDAWGEGVSSTWKRGFDSVVQAGTGISQLYGSKTNGEWTPGALPVQALDHSTGLGMAAALLALVKSRNEGISGSAQLSLARTAFELLSHPTPSDNATSIPSLKKRTMDSAYGKLSFVPPAVTGAEFDVEFTSAPVKYGSSQLEWI